MKLKPEIQELLIQGVMQHGTVRAALKTLPVKITEDKVSRFRRENKRFSGRMELAKTVWKNRHPEEDIFLQQRLHTALVRQLKHGTVVTKDVFDIRDGKRIHRQQIVTRTMTLDPRIWEIINPKQEFSVNALLMILPNLVTMIEQGDFSAEQKTFLREVFADFGKRYLDELSKRGLPAKTGSIEQGE